MSIKKPATRLNIYCDESGTRDGKYLLIGGVWSDQDREEEVRNEFREVRANYSSHGLQHEMKWRKISAKFLPAYKQFIDVFFRHSHLHFNCIVIDKSKVNYKEYHEDDKEVGFYKFYHFMLRSNLKPNCYYWVYTDELRTRKPRLPTLMQVTNNWCSTNLGMRPIVNIEPRSSTNEDLIQVADLLLGAVNCAYNGSTTSQARLEFVDYIAREKMKWQTLKVSRYKARPINIWFWKPSPKPVVRPTVAPHPTQLFID